MKIVLAGLGSIGQRHARNLRALLGDQLELLAYRTMRRSPVIHENLTVDAGQNPEQTYGIRAFKTLSDALAERPDALFVTNPNHLHMSVAFVGANAGCHLFIEKPISHTLEGTAELAALVERQHLVCAVGYQLRFHPGLAMIKSLLETNAIGPIIGARVMFGEYLPGWHPYEDYRQYHAARAMEGGGVLLTQIHDLDVVYALFGMPRRVVALGRKGSHFPIDVEDNVDLLLECCVNGRLIHVHVHQDFAQRPPVRTYEITGEQGRILWDYFGNCVSVYRSNERTSTDTTHFSGLKRNQLFLDEVRHFLACVSGDAAPVAGLQDGVNTLRIALAAKASLERKAFVELSEEA